MEKIISYNGFGVYEACTQVLVNEVNRKHLVRRWRRRNKTNENRFNRC